MQFSRHILLALLAVLLLLPSSPVHADDDLLDPGEIGSARKSVAAEGLLDPAMMSAKSTKAAKTSTAHRRTNHQAPSYARGMATSVTNSLDTLTRTAAELVDEILKLDREARDLAERIKVLKENMDIKLEEYRSGLFCSGCNKTKSEILAEGSQFPHPGQSIIRPTPEQIAAKERELQAPIDRAENELAANQARHGKAIVERDEALLQIGYGLSLWRTSISFENLLITLDENESIAAYEAERQQVEGQISKLDVEIHNEDIVASTLPSLTDENNKLEEQLKQLAEYLAANDQELANTKAQLDLLTSEAQKANGDANKLAHLATERAKLKSKLKECAEKAASYKEDQSTAVNQKKSLSAKIQKANSSKAKMLELTHERDDWSATLDRLDQQRAKDRRDNQNSMANADANASREQGALAGYIKRGKLYTVLSVAVDARLVGAGGDFEGLGGGYRMGSFDIAHHGDILPSVNDFIAAFRNASHLGQQGNAGLTGRLPTPVKSPMTTR